MCPAGMITAPLLVPSSARASDSSMQAERKEIRADLTLLEWADEDAVWPPASSPSSQQHSTPVTY